MAALAPGSRVRLQAKRAVSLQTNALDLPGPQPQRRRMAGVDDARPRVGQVNPHEQAGNELTLARLRGQRIIASRACSASSTPRRRALRRPRPARSPTGRHPSCGPSRRSSTRATCLAPAKNRTCHRRSHRRLQPGGESERPASQVKAPGNSRCWISAANDNGTERCPHSKRSV